MTLKEYYLKNILRKKRKEFLQYIGVSSTSLVYYLNGRLPRKDILNKIIIFSKGKITLNDFYKLKINNKD